MPRHGHTQASVYAKVDKKSPCWRWTGSHTSAGRPQVNFDRQPWYVYRLLYTWEHGPIPPGMTLDHLCGNGWCCNPAHTTPVSNSENVARALQVRYIDRQETCLHGHDRAKHSKFYPDGKRYCGECNRLKSARRYWATKNSR